MPIAANIVQLIWDLGLIPPTLQVPLYGPPPHCNQRNLTALGQYLINKMIDRKFIIEVDHMDEITADTTMDIIESRQYPGVINSHSDWSSNPDRSDPGRRWVRGLQQECEHWQRHRF